MSETLLQVQDIRKEFIQKKVFSGGPPVAVKAVDGISLTVNAGEIIGIVGESGCGKSTLGRVILKLQNPTSGTIMFEGQDITAYSEAQMRPLRRHMQLIFQDPYASLNPRMNILHSISAPLDAFETGTRSERYDKVLSMMEQVGLPADFINKYPHEMSGGQRQRVAIARAMITQPKFVVCDEPVSALDVSVRAQVLNLMRRMQRQYGMAYLFISHDLSVIRYLCDRVEVLYLGHIVESATKKELFENPLHPYTKALMEAIPLADVDRRRKRSLLDGDIPSPINPPSGCQFHTRCKYCKPECAQTQPQLQKITSTHSVACPFCESLPAWAAEDKAVISD